MKANISQLNLYMECPRKWYFKYVLKKGIESSSQALLDGLDWHDLMESNPSSDLSIREGDPLWMKAGYDSWLAWKEQAKRDGFEFLGKEIELEAPLGPYTLFGRLDALVKWNGLLWHLQHKTVAPTKPISTYQRYVAKSWHEHGYQHLIENASKDGEKFATSPYGGCLLVICRKLADKTMKGYSDAGLSNLVVSYLSLPDHIRTMRDIEDVVGRMEYLDLRNTTFPPGNPNMCAGFYGNSLCQYIDVCDGHGSIEDFPSIDPLKGYTHALR